MNTPLYTIKQLLRRAGEVTTTAKPIHRGNSGHIWPIQLPNGKGETVTVKTNPITMTPDAMSLFAAAYLDRVGVDRSIAMRFGLVFYALAYGCWLVLPDVKFKLEKLWRDNKVVEPLRGTVAHLLEWVLPFAESNPPPIE